MLLPPTDIDLIVFPFNSGFAPNVLSDIKAGCNDDNVLARFVIPDILLFPLNNIVLFETFKLIFVPTCY
jgi:hypothetical protein